MEKLTPKQKEAIRKAQEAEMDRKMNDKVSKDWPGYGLTGQAGKAGKSVHKRPSKLEQAEMRALGLNCGGSVKKMKAGGKIRGAGCCTKGVRKAKYC